MPKEIINSENNIGAKSFFQGRFVLKGNLQVYGKYEGDLLEVDTLFIGKTGKVKTHIKANNVIIEGIVIGSIQANIRVLLYPTARILGNIETPELIIQHGVIFEGKCQITNNPNTSSSELITTLYDDE